jgi:hypothetical protein
MKQQLLVSIQNSNAASSSSLSFFKDLKIYIPFCTYFYRVTICTTHCKYEVVQQVALQLGIRDVGEDDSWNLYWTDLSMPVEKAKEMKRFQVTDILQCHFCVILTKVW